MKLTPAHPLETGAVWKAEGEKLMVYWITQ